MAQSITERLVATIEYSGVYDGITSSRLAQEAIHFAESITKLDIGGFNIRNIDPRDAKERLRREKNSRLLALLARRAKSKSGVSVTLLRNPGEAIHAYSQNVLVFGGPALPDETTVSSQLHMIGQEEGLNSLDITDLIGEPDAERSVSPTTYIRKVREEIRSVEKAHAQTKDHATLQRLSHLRHDLAANILLERISLSPDKDKRVLTVGLSHNHSSILLNFQAGERTIIELTPDLEELVERGGGFDFWRERDASGQEITIVNGKPRGIRLLERT